MAGRDAPRKSDGPPAGHELAVGTELGGYRIESLLGRGGMGVVYRAHDVALDRKVALKLLAPELAEDARFRERFLRESRLAASLDHPAIVPIYDAGEVAGQLYIAMRLVNGSDLKRLLAEERVLEPERATHLLGQVADALDFAHERGLVHRDVKPSNVLIDERGHCYLADFGLSRRLAEATDVGDGRSLGTIDYVAPEQIRGDDLDGRADLYSLGCMLYECLAGRPPFAGSNTAIVFAHLEEEPQSLPGLEQVIRTALAKEPDDRYQSGRELIEAAREALGIGQRRSRWPYAAVALGVVMAGAALLGVLIPRGGGDVQAEPGADSLVRIDAKTNAVTSTTPVGLKASGIAAAGRYVWVTSFADGTVWRIDPRTRSVIKIPTGGSPTGVAASPVSVLVANGPEHSLSSIDPRDGSVRWVARLPGDPGATIPVAARGNGVWFADATERLVGQVQQTITGGGAPEVTIDVPADETSLLTTYGAFDGLAAGEGAIWAAGDAFGRTVWRIDPVSRRVVASIKLRFVPGSIAAGEGAVWVTSLLDDHVLKINPATNRVTARISVPNGVAGVAVGEGAVWVASSTARVVSRIDPRTDRVVATVAMIASPIHVAVGPDGVWVTTAKPAPVIPRDAIGIGVLADCTGPFGSFYDQSVAAAELVLLHHGGSRAGPRVADGVKGARIGGKPVALALACTNGTTSSALFEARRLVEQIGVRIVIGPTYADEELALHEYARRRPGIAFVNALAGAQVLDPPANVFSFMPDGAQWMAGLGTYAYRTLGWRRAVIVADEAGSGFNWAQTAGFTAEFCSLGGTIVKRVWVPRGTQDYSALVGQIPQQGVDGVVAATGPQTVLALAKHYPGLRGNVSRRLIPGAIAYDAGVGQLGKRLSGTLVGAWWHLTPGRARTRYVNDLRKHFPHISQTGVPFDVAYYDAMAATLAALARVDGDLSGGETRYMAALARVKLDSVSGSIRLDSNRTAVAPNYLARLDGTLYRRVDGVEHTFGGYFQPTDPPPSRTTPVCKPGQPPSWAR